jgi:CAI-1 autoinducer synthase
LPGGRADHLFQHFKGYFLSESRPAIFSSCLLGHELAWFDAALDFIRWPGTAAPAARACAPCA